VTSPPPPARLPLFPLPLVLFPGAAQPLHIFEPRYRRLLADVRAADGRFGIVAATGADAGAPPGGRVGCVAHVRDVEPLPDGRSNLVVDGGARFAIVRLIDAGTPYLVAEVEPYEDAPDPAAGPHQLQAAAARVRDLFDRVARAARTIADEIGAAPALPDDPAEVAFAVAARVEFDLAARQRLLASRSAVGRLDDVAELLERAVGNVEERAATHERARSNGHGPAHHGPGAA
jgi:Lon protease-like protein